jgi:hypothetical protein
MAVYDFSDANKLAAQQTKNFLIFERDPPRKAVDQHGSESGDATLQKFEINILHT